MEPTAPALGCEAVTSGPGKSQGRAVPLSSHVLHSLRCVTHLIKVIAKSNPLRKCFRDFLGNILLLCDLLHQIVYFVQVPGKQCFVKIL